MSLSAALFLASVSPGTFLFSYPNLYASLTTGPAVGAGEFADAAWGGWAGACVAFVTDAVVGVTGKDVVGVVPEAGAGIFLSLVPWATA